MSDLSGPVASGLGYEPSVVLAEKGEQCGEAIWIGRCNRCGKQIVLNDLGRIICTCGEHLRYVEKRAKRQE